MRAMQFDRYGGPEVLRPVDTDVPTPSAGQLLVRVHCASVNPVDWKRASGVYRWLMPVRFPAVPCYDIAGEVVAVGSGVTEFSVGEHVHARIGEAAGGGAAEFACVGVGVTARIPTEMDFATAAALPLAGMTALQALRDVARLDHSSAANQRVLVIGASGGVGHLGVQIAKAMGAHVAGVCSSRNVELVRSLGADEVIDYTQPNHYANRAAYDVVLDCVGAVPRECLPVFAAQGRYVSVIPGPSTFLWPALHLFSARSVKACMLKASAADLQALDALWTQQRLSVAIDGRYPLERLGDAWRRSISGRAVGKIVIDVA